MVKPHKPRKYDLGGLTYDEIDSVVQALAVYIQQYAKFEDVVKVVGVFNRLWELREAARQLEPIDAD